MGKIRWYKRDVSAALSGMIELTLEERGAYNTVLDLIYDKADQLPDDDRYIAWCCRCDLRVWKRLKKGLIERGKLHVENGLLRNFRATSEVSRALAIGTSRAEAAKSKARKSSDVLGENNDLASASAYANAPAKHPVRARENLESRIKKDISDSSSPHPPAGGLPLDRFPIFDRLPREGPSRKYPEEFERFWQVYPRRSTDTKKTAYIAWRKPASNGVGVEVLHTKALECRALMQATDGEPKLIQSWINAEGWTATYELPERRNDGRPGEIRSGPAQPGGRYQGPASFVEATRQVLAARSGKP